MAVKAKAIMFQGTGSNVGKSLLSAAIIRAFYHQGVKVTPFKPQNMSNNAAVTVDGGEIGRAQALQARAANIAPMVNMNPILLKPEHNQGSQLIIHGHAQGHVKAKDYYTLKQTTLMPAIQKSFDELRNEYELIIVEGAGSPAEINLRAGDVANMGFAEAVDIDAILIADIDKGGVLANIVGTWALLSPEDQNRLKGYIINKFRGDMALFQPAITQLQQYAPLECYGIMPFEDAALSLPGEDSLTIGKFSYQQQDNQKIKVVALQLQRVANSDDLDPLQYDEQIDLQILQYGQSIPLDADLVILLGSKTTIGDLNLLKQYGWDIELRYYHKMGGCILGICGGYQILGKSIADPEGIESDAGTVAQGLGLLNIDTVLQAPKTLENHKNIKNSLNDYRLSGYEIHMGKSNGDDCQRHLLQFNNGRYDGAISPDGRVMGGYVHGLFAAHDFRKSFFAMISQKYDGDYQQMIFEQYIDQQLDHLAQSATRYLSLEAIYKLAR